VIDKKIRIGIDSRGDLYYVARVQHMTGRPEVRTLARFEASHVTGHHLLVDAGLVFAVSDSNVLRKNLHFPGVGQYDPEMLVNFEMTQSLIEREHNFCFDTVLFSNDNRFIGLAVRKEHLDNLSKPFLSCETDDSTECHFMVRAKALGMGYITYCRSEVGEFVCLADFANKEVSICFVFRNQISGLTYLPTDKLDLESKTGLDKMAVEFKTILNFELVRHREQGISIPLSALVLSGDIADDRIKTTLQKYFTTKISSPEISGGFFPDPQKMKGIPLERYLVALGLATGE